MNDDDHETHDEYEDRKSEHEDNCLAELNHKNQVLRDRDINRDWDLVARDRFLSVYGATIAVQWAAHVGDGRGLDDASIKRFVSEARALAQWTEDVQR